MQEENLDWKATTLILKFMRLYYKFKTVVVQFAEDMRSFINMVKRVIYPLIIVTKQKTQEVYYVENATWLSVYLRMIG